MPKGRLRAIPGSVWALGFVSLLMDTSSELIHSLLPIFLVSVLGASMTSVGIIEGVAEATASIAKLFSGVLSDRFGKRKLLTGLGYGLAALTKPLFPLAGSIATVLAARFIDRVGKGIRGAPRDALIGDIAPPHVRGASYGLRQALDTVGAFIGPLLAVALMALLANDIRSVFWIAVIPAILAVVTLVVFVREPPAATRRRTRRWPIHAAELRRLGAAYVVLLVVAAVLTLARFSEAFLLLRASGLGLSMAYVPLVLVVMNIVYAATAYPAGAWSDRQGRRVVLSVGIAVLILSDLVLAIAPNLLMVMGGVVLWGLHMGLTQGLLSTMVADAAPPELRGTAFGVFHLVSGLALFGASVLAGFVWDQLGPAATFGLGGAFAALAWAGFAISFRVAARAAEDKVT